jgi:hypothetical protein
MIETVSMDSSARMTIHDALDHPWLREDHSDRDSRIPANRFDNVRQRIRDRYVSYSFVEVICVDRFLASRLDILIRLLALVAWQTGVHFERIDHKITISTVASGVDCSTR